MKISKTLIFLLSLFIFNSSLSASPLLWQNNQIFLLHGEGYEVNPDKQTNVTLEHASGWSWGDIFAFVDINKYHDSNVESDYYGELSPRISLVKLSGNSMEYGLIKDILLASTLEFGEGDVEGLLLGVGLDLDIPGFNFFSLNLYQRFIETNRDGETIQITPAWSINLSQNVSFEGYIDWNINDDRNYSGNFHFNPRIKYNLPFSSSVKSTIGLEYSYWKNKYGIKNSSGFKTNQNALSFFISLGF